MKAEGFVGEAGRAEDAVDVVASVKAGWVWPAVLLQETLQYVRHWCTEQQGLYFSEPL